MGPKTIVITHHNADLDALATMIAASKLYDATPVRGKSVSPPVQRYLAMHKDHFPLVWYHEIDPAQVERVIVVDVRDRRRLKEYEPILANNPEIICYDHHPASEHDLVCDWVLVDPTGACVTLLIEKLRHSDAALTEAEISLMMLGLYADTGRLSFTNTSVRDIDAAAWLLRRGANMSVVNKYLQEVFSPEQRQLLASLMDTCEEVSIDAVEFAIATATAPRFVRGASSAVQHVMRMGGHDAILGVIEFVKDKRVQIIGRSRVPYIDMGELLKSFGGGGHAGAAAATLKKTSLADALERIDAILREYPLEPTRVQDIMSAPVQCIDHRATLEELDQLLECLGISGVPVLKDDRLVGVISHRDLERARAKGVDFSLPVSAKMSNQIKSIPPDEPLEDAFDMMTDADIGRLPVVSHDGRLVGIISRTDMIRRLYHNANKA